MQCLSQYPKYLTEFYTDIMASIDKHAYLFNICVDSVNMFKFGNKLKLILTHRFPLK